jgi:iron complex outermembrane receptor protein
MKIKFISFGFLFISFPLFANDTLLGDLSKMRLEELMAVNVIVTSAAKKPQKLGNAASAIYVLTGNDIHRSGATTLG